MLHILLQTTEPSVDMTHWTPAAVGTLIASLGGVIVGLTALIASIRALLQARQAQTESANNRMQITSNDQRHTADVRSMNEQITNVAKDLPPKELVVPLVEATKVLKDCTDTLRGH